MNPDYREFVVHDPDFGMDIGVTDFSFFKGFFIRVLRTQSKDANSISTCFFELSNELAAMILDQW